MKHFTQKNSKHKYSSKNITSRKYTKKIPSDIKKIFIYDSRGFGNKVFDLILALYLYNLYNVNGKKCIIYYVLGKSIHDLNGDPKLFDIFSNSIKKIKFLELTKEQFYNKIDKFDTKVIGTKYINSLDEFPKFDELTQSTYYKNFYHLTYLMYNTFNKIDRQVFTIDKSLISQNILNITKDKYALIHIRYGDKLNILINSIKKNDNDKIDFFLLYTPEYYIKMIRKLLKQNIPIIIVSDSMNIVKKFIIDSEKNNNNFNNEKNIILLDTHWLNTYYLLYYAKEIVLSCSTFSFAGAYYNKFAKCYLCLYHDVVNKNINKNINKEEYAISEKWIIYKDRKYILNYNKNLAFKMQKYL
jgi:hypothetical protein